MEKSKLRNILDLIVKPYKAEMIILAVLWGVFFVLNVFFGDIEPQYAAAIAILIGTVFVFFGIQAMFRRSEKNYWISLAFFDVELLVCAILLSFFPVYSLIFFKLHLGQCICIAGLMGMLRFQYKRE